MILVIDTSESDFLQMGIFKANGKTISQKKVFGKHLQSENLLPSINNLLELHKIKVSQLTGLTVVTGPGGFTSLRIGVITANALAYALDIPVVGFKKSEFKDFHELAKKAVHRLKKTKVGNIVKPHYGREPNITQPKRH